MKNFWFNKKKVDEVLNTELDTELENEEILEEQQEDEEELNLVDIELNKKRKKIALISTGAIIATASIVTISSFFMGVGKKKYQQVASEDLANDNEIVSELDTLSMDDLGIELAFTDENKEYGETTGNVDINTIVEDSNGTVWANPEAASKADTVGKVVTDTKNDTLKVTNDGKVVEKQEGYEIKDSNGNTVSSGEGSVPPGYSWDSKRNEYVPTSEVGKYVYSDTNFYSQDGTLIISKGDLVAVETYNRAKKELLTTKPANNNQSNNNQSNNTQKPTQKPDGTYKDSLGNVWASKSDYDKGLEDSTGVYMENGVLHYSSSLSTKNKPSNTPSKPSNNNTTNNSTSSKPSNNNTTNNTTPSKPSNNNSTSNKPTNNGKYTDSNGLVWASKSDYDKAIANNWDKVGELNGVLYYDVEKQYNSKTR